MMDREFVVIDGKFKGKVMYVINCSEATGVHKTYCADAQTGDIYYLDTTSLRMTTESNQETLKKIINGDKDGQ